jgi:hypothetical protein
MTKIELSRDRTARARLMRKSTLDVAQERFANGSYGRYFHAYMQRRAQGRDA